eukprot:3322481-Rhodomonas_salina.2
MSLVPLVRDLDLSHNKLQVRHRPSSSCPLHSHTGHLLRHSLLLPLTFPKPCVFQLQTCNGGCTPKLNARTPSVSDTCRDTGFLPQGFKRQLTCVALVRRGFPTSYGVSSAWYLPGPCLRDLIAILVLTPCCGAPGVVQMPCNAAPSMVLMSCSTAPRSGSTSRTTS